MFRSSLLVVAALVFTAFAGGSAAAQAGRSSVSGNEVTGTFRSGFTGRFKGISNDIRILALGKGKLRVAFDLIYPMMVRNQPSANTGEGGGVATISGDTAVFETTEFGSCSITIKFLRPGTIKVTQSGTDAECGFGHNVSATGTYRKVSSKKPRFDDK